MLHCSANSWKMKNIDTLPKTKSKSRPQKWTNTKKRCEHRSHWITSWLITRKRCFRDFFVFLGGNSMTSIFDPSSQRAFLCRYRTNSRKPVSTPNAHDLYCLTHALFFVCALIGKIISMTFCTFANFPFVHMIGFDMPITLLNPHVRLAFPVRCCSAYRARPSRRHSFMRSSTGVLICDSDIQHWIFVSADAVHRGRRASLCVRLLSLFPDLTSLSGAEQYNSSRP